MKTVEIDGEKFIREKDCSQKKVIMAKGDDSNPFMEIGVSYFIRTVTNYFTGRLIWVGDKEIVLEDVCWIADTGKFSDFASEKTVNESEPFPKGKNVIIGRGAIVDMVEHGLILTVK